MNAHILFDTHSMIQSLDDLRKRLAVMDNELNKERAVSRRYQVATEKLMQFVGVSEQSALPAISSCFMLL
jgi:hypothetical protein